MTAKKEADKDAKKPEPVKLKVLTKDGKKSSEEVELRPEIYSAPVNERLLNIVFTSYAANQRRGTHDTKVRKEVRGGGRKPWKQKGTGRARAGSSRSPVWRGGGTVFGPHPRDYSSHIPAELRRQALISALSLKCQQEDILIVDDASVEQPKTKEMVQMIKALKLDGTRTLCVVKSIDEKLKRASSNLKEVFRFSTAGDFNAYQVLRRKKLLIDKQALPLIEKRILEGELPVTGAGGASRSKEKVGV
jgi:large subunit ribosomal protein L4